MQLEVQHADNPKEIFHIQKELIVIGRSTKCDLRLSYPGISREHLKIELKDGEVYITDLESTNGVYVDGQRIQANIPIHYQTYLSLVIGETSLQLTLPADATSSFTVSTRVTLPPPKIQKAPGSFPTWRASSKKRSKNSYVLGLVGLGILATGVYFTQNQSDEVVDKPKSAPAQTTALKASPLIVGFDSPEDYLQIWKEGGCKSRDEQTICQKFKPAWFKNEHLIIREKVYVFVNLTQELQYRGYPSDKLEKLSEILLANYSTHPLIRELNRPTFAIGFIEVDDRTEIKFVLSQNMSEVPILEESIHRSVFSRALVGEDWLFGKIIRPYITFKKI